MDFRRFPVPVSVLTLVFSTLACLGGLSPAGSVDLAVSSGGNFQTADVATQAAVETQVAARKGPAVLDLTEVKLTAHSCAPHPDSSGYDCSFTDQFTLSYETTDWTRLQCFFSSQESEKTNVAPGVSQMSVSITWDSLFYAPGTKVGAFCQLRDQISDEWLAEDFLGEGPYDEAFFLPVP